MAIKKKNKEEEEVKIEEVSKSPVIEKYVAANGRFQMVNSEAGIGIYSPDGKLVGKEKNEQKAKDMVMRFNYLAGIK